MKRYVFVVAICLIAVMVATVAFAAAVRVVLEPFDPDGYGSGRAILNYAEEDGKTEMQINCRGLNPGTDYTVYMKPPEESFIPIGTFVAKKNGKGHLHARESGDCSTYIIAVNETEANETILIDERY